MKNQSMKNQSMIKGITIFGIILLGAVQAALAVPIENEIPAGRDQADRFQYLW